MATEYANGAALVSTDWVAENLNNPAVRLIEVDVDTTAYDQGHIPGAVGFNWATQLTDQIRRDIPPKAQWEALLSEAGVWPDLKIVFYGDNNNWFAAYAYWVARLYGHTDVALMNGGRKKWELEGRSLVTDAPSVKPSKYQAKDLDLAFRAFQREVLDYVGANGGKALVDVRSPAEFSGEIVAPPGLPETAQRAGHIPGASNIPWAQTVNEDGTFKSADDLKTLYSAKGITPDKDVVAYCRIGERSSHSWFVLSQLLGFPKVRNYDGSWTEWGSIIGAPIDNPAAS
ncbi:MAG: sulfurtransferase [Chloroflexi bacterium]|nr:sulfurtransferase [Chloroflexota bacterium]